MKIRLQSGKTIEDALLTAVECLKENEENYQMVKGCATLYVTLLDENGNESPHNNEEFVIGDDGMYNLNDVLKEDAKKHIISNMEMEISSLYEKEFSLQKEITDTQAKLKKAIERNFKTKDKWAESLKGKQEQLERFVSVEKPNLESIKKAFEAHKITYFIKTEEQSLPYYYNSKGKKKVALIACVIHADIGDVGFFAREHYHSYGQFRMVSEKWCPADNQYINYN